MNKEVNTLLLVVIAIILIVLAVQPLAQIPQQGYSELGVLGPNQTIGGYPTNVVVGKPLVLYGFVGDHEGFIEYYQILVKLGSANTNVSNVMSENAPIILSFSRVLDNNQSYIFPINITLSSPSSNTVLIFELWQYSSSQSSFIFTGLWDKIHINVTDS